MWKIIEINVESLSDNPRRISTLSGNISTKMVTATLGNKNGTLDTTFSKNGFYRSQFFPTGSKIKKRGEQRGTRGPGNDEGSVIRRRNGGGCHRYSNRSRLATFHHRFISVFFGSFSLPYVALFHK